MLIELVPAARLGISLMKKLFVYSVLMMAVALTGCVVYQNIEPQPLGWTSPSLSAQRQDGKVINMKSATSGPWAAVFFYPEADTPG